MDVYLYRPQAKVTFYTEKGELVARATNNPNSAIDDDILSITTVRDLQADCPTFNLTMTCRKPWDKWVASNDLLVVELHRPPETLKTVFIGLVDDCRRRLDASQNNVSRVISVTGRGLGKSFIRFDVGVVPEAEYASTTTGWLEQAGVTLAGSAPTKIISSIWDKIAKPHIKYSWSNGKSLWDYMTRDFSDIPNIQLLDSSTIMNWEGNLHTLIKDIAEEPFYEVFYDIDPQYSKYVNMTVRPTPFDKADWDKLPLTVIQDSDVVSEDLGRSDLETYSIYSVGAKSLFSPQDTYKTFGSLPLWYKPYAEKYGNYRLHVESSYMTVAESSDVELQTETMKTFMEKLFNWNIKNNSMYNGTIVMKGSNKYRIGTRIEFYSKEHGVNLEFYVTSVTHNFMNMGYFTTTLGVTRGIEKDKRFTAPWGKHTEYSGLGLLPFDPEGSRAAMQLTDSQTSGSVGGISSAVAQKVVDLAMSICNNGLLTPTGKLVKVKYTFGGYNLNTGALDCSSFTHHVYKTAANMDIGRTTGVQVGKGTQISKEQALPGDLIFFKNTYNSSHQYGVSHVGIWLGNDEFVHNGGTTVNVAKLSNSYYSKHFLMFRRVLVMDNITMGGGGGGGNVDVNAVMAKGTKFQATSYGATAINLMGGPGWVPTFKTSIGTTPVEGRTIATDPKVIPRHSLLTLVCPSYPSVNGNYVAEDVGGAIKGNKVDIYFNDLPPADPYKARERMKAFGRRDVYIVVTRKGKG